MLFTTVCYIEKDNKYLMLHRTKKEKDINKDKWIGIGGKFEQGESPEECIVREVKEETGLTLKSYNLKCLITFDFGKFETEYMYVFTSDDFNGTINNSCKEGELKWVDKDKIMELNLWEGDKIFLEKIQNNAPFFTVKMQYDGDKLIKYTINQY